MRTTDLHAILAAPHVALAAAQEGPQRAAVTSAFASALETGKLVGAAAVLAGGLLAAALLRRAG
ncbi:hypothetical protein ACLQ24_09190 [Micromonospora sp. DT4]|uniref:hypothetical protein n=1 Tax=Micromonospora sp. DT4 TaxID=3393438 RepID=UPI003CE98464